MTKFQTEGKRGKNNERILWSIYKNREKSIWPRNCIVSSLSLNQRQHCSIGMLCAASCTKQGYFKSRSESYLISFRLHAGHRAEGAAEAHAWLLGIPPTNHLQWWEGGCRPCQWGPLLEWADPGEVSLGNGGGWLGVSWITSICTLYELFWEAQWH